MHSVRRSHILLFSIIPFGSIKLEIGSALKDITSVYSYWVKQIHYTQKGMQNENDDLFIYTLHYYTWRMIITKSVLNKYNNISLRTFIIQHNFKLIYVCILIINVIILEIIGQICLNIKIFTEFLFCLYNMFFKKGHMIFDVKYEH